MSGATRSMYDGVPAASPAAPEVHDDGARVALISPVHNEARHLREVADGVAQQTRPPDLWMIVDDNSTDDTRAVLAEVAERLPFVRVVTAPAGGQGARDKLAACRPEISFNCGLSHLNLEEFTHVGKLDGDIVMPPNYLELILSAFREDPRLGVAGGVFNERDASGEWKLLPTAPEAISPNARLYSRECFESIGGMPSCLGADVITTVRARMKGFSTRTFPELPYKHLRPIGTADGTLRGRYRHGAYQYIVGYGFWWILARSFLVGIRFRPRALSGLAFFAGYASGLVGRTKRVDDPEFLVYMRYELRARMRQAIRRRIESRGASHGSAAA